MRLKTVVGMGMGIVNAKVLGLFLRRDLEKRPRRERDLEEKET